MNWKTGDRFICNIVGPYHRWRGIITEMKLNGEVRLRFDKEPDKEYYVFSLGSFEHEEVPTDVSVDVSDYL